VSDDVRPEVVQALARVTPPDPAKAEVAYNATDEERRLAARASAEAAVAELVAAGVIITPNPLDMTVGQWEVLAGCYGVISQWDVSVNRRRRAGDVIDALALDGGELPLRDAALVLGWLELVDLLPPREAGT
jgi:hypothetical protein